jgi:hypothetical protein
VDLEMNIVGRSAPWSAILAGVVFGLGATACAEPVLTVPTAAEVEAMFDYQGELTVEIKGNVAEIRVAQSRTQLRRGGALWAKVGPQIFLFSEETRDLFLQYNGLAGVRVISTTGGREVSRAILLRDELNDVTWRRALNISGIARRDGSQHPSRIEALVHWGEDHTEYEYNPDFIPD